MSAQRSLATAFRPWAVAALTVLVLFISTGCCSHAIRERQIEVTLDDALVGRSVAVVFYGANSTELDTWRNKSIDDFFGPDDPLFKGSVKGAVTFPAGGTAKTMIFSSADPIWQKWKDRQAWDLVAMASIPDSPVWNGPTASDPRRQIVPLDQTRWENCGANPIKLRVQLGALTTETPPLPAQ